MIMRSRLRLRLRLGLGKRCLAGVVLILAALSAGRAPVAGATGNEVECANLIYAGTKSSVCFGEEFLATVASQTSINTSRKFKPVKLGESEVFHFPFAVMTGEGAFTLTDDERKNLKLYLEKGGFLLASAGCSSKEWGDSFTREMEAILPDRKLEEVPMSHPIFRTVFDVDRLDMSHGGDGQAARFVHRRQDRGDLLAGRVERHREHDRLLLLRRKRDSQQPESQRQHPGLRAAAMT